MEKKGKRIWWFIQHLIASPLFWTVVAAVGTVIWTWVKGWFASPYAPLTSPIILLVIGLIFYVASQIRNYQRGRNVNYQELIMKWLFHYGYAIRKVVPANALWQVRAMPEGKGAVPINIGVLKTEPDFVKIGIGGNLEPLEVQNLAKITSKSDSTLIEELRIEMNRLGLENKGLAHPLREVYLAHSMALDSTLTQLSFMQTFLRVRQAWELYRNIVVKYQKEHGISVPIPDKEDSENH